MCISTPVWGRELQRVNDMLWSPLQPLLCLMTVCVAPRSVLHRLAAFWEWVDSADVHHKKNNSFFLSMLISFQFKQWHLGAPWSCTVAEGTATQRSLKIWEGQLSVRDQMSGMEWGCKTIYGGLWLLCKHGRDERTENRGGQKSHDSETGGGVRIRKAVMITDQSQTPEAGARQVVYTHMHTHRRTHTKQVNVHLHTCYKFAARRRHFHSYWMGRQNLQFNLQNLKPI